MLPVAPAAEKNKAAILSELKNLLKADDIVLEIGSGTGQHVCYFAQQLPEIQWLPTDLPENLDTINARRLQCGLSNIRPAAQLDVQDASSWPDVSVTACLTINTLHIINKSAVVALFQGCSRKLRPGGMLIVYGPFSIDGEHTSDSNARFNNMLKAQDPDSGVRDLTWLDEQAKACGFQSHRAIQMPVNNQLVIFESAD